MGAKETAIEKAQAFAAKGNFDKAAAEYKKAVTLDPKDVSVRLKLGDLHVKTGNKTEAVNEYKEVAKVHSQKGFYLKAIAVYKQILKIEEANFDVHYKLAELYARQKLTSDAISEYSILVNSFEKKGKTGEVVQLLKEMLDIDPENTTVRLKLAQHYQKLNFEKDALNEYGIIFEKYVVQNKLDKAEKLYHGLHDANPQNAQILKGLAVINIKRGDGGKFLKYAKPLFHIYKETGDAENAKAMAEAIVDADKKDMECLTYLGRDTGSGVWLGAKPTEKPAEKPAEKPPIKTEAPSSDGEPLISFPDEPVKTQAAPKPKEEDEPLISWPEEGIEIGVKPEAPPLIEFPSSVEAKKEEPVEEELPPPVEAKKEEPVEEEVELPLDGALPASSDEDEFEVEIPSGDEETELEGEVIEIETPTGEMSQTDIDELMVAGHLTEAAEEVTAASEVEMGGGVNHDEHPHGGAQTSAVSHEDLFKSITELTEHVEPDEEISDVLLVDTEEIIEEPVPVTAKKAWREKKEDYVDLSAELGLDASSMREEEEEEAEAGKEDFETHFNLGIAYMEMEMHGEAAKEFKIALKDPKLEFECYTRLGLCAMSEKNYDEAIACYVKGLKIPNRNDDERKGMMYELAIVYEASHKKEEAFKLFGAINSIDPDYREASLKVKLYSEDAVKIPKDDGLIEVELL
ncbi:MAG: tetratricopeptide repeat protein [Deltaproteobacteria bacterium]|nr:tetratricopeptide repeat protein [Deltaproteobacteria bacterium]